MPPKKKQKMEAPDMTQPQWQWLDDDAAWTTFDPKDSATIETGFCKKLAMLVTKDLTFNHEHGSLYVFDFTKMTQENKESGTVRTICRLAPSGECRWEWKDDQQCFVPFFDEDHHVIESLFRKTPLGVASAQATEFSFNKGFDTPYTFTFAKSDPAQGTASGSQHNTQSGTSREIRRVSKKQPWNEATYGIAAAAPPVPPPVTAAPATAAAPAVPASPSKTGAAPSGGSSLDPPPTWKTGVPLKNAAMGLHTLVPVGKTDPEYATLTQQFLAGVGGKKTPTVVSLTRIENSMLYGFYAMTRSHIAGRNGGEPHEIYAFGGISSRPNLGLVFKLGYDVRVSAETGASGTGLYFGAQASYVNNGRCLANNDGSREILIVRLAKGSVTKGVKGEKRPPPKDPKQPTMDRYDSCVDAVGNPTVHVVFDHSQVYPAYVLKYIP